MTTTEKLREALQAVEPGWAVPDADTLKRQARRLRLRRRIATVVVLATVGATGVVARPHVLPHAGDGSTAASLQRAQTVPTTVAGAVAVTDLHVREGALPRVTQPGRMVTVSLLPDKYQLRPPRSAWYAVGELCATDGGDCVLLETRDQGGWVAVTQSKTVVGGREFIGPNKLVVETPVAGVVAAIDGTRIHAELIDLGQGYTLVSVPATAVASRSGGEPAAGPVKVWAFSPRGELVARYPR